ncbi:MAG: hypothetical protein IJC88_02320 [Oscillospiraceae bacterium]|nr:hypothetical protein [Oscillospiraceae bacterium]
MLIAILEKAILLVVAAIFALAGLRIVLRAKNVNHTERVQIFKSAEYLNAWILLLCFVTTMVFGVFNHFDLKQSVHAIVSLNYSEASQALNSNGTHYNMAEIISDEVVERAIKKGALEDVTVKQLKNCLVVYPCVQGGVGDETEYHISTEFAVEYHASKDTAHLDSENVIKLITSAYKEYYIERYTDNFKLDAEKPDFTKMEYMDIVLYLDKETQAILDYLYGLAGQNPSFTTEDGSTFSSIAGKVHQFQQTQINQNLKSLILQNGLARNKQGYIDRLSYHNKNVDFTRQKNDVSYRLCNQAIEKYSEEMTRIVLVPTWDKDGKYYMGRTKVGVDELSVMATKFSDYVASNEKEMMDNNLIIGKITSGVQSTQAFAAADTLIDSIYTNIQNFGAEAINAGKECSRHKMNQCIAVSIYGVSLMSELKELLLFAAFAYVAFVLSRIAKKFPKKA